MLNLTSSQVCVNIVSIKSNLKPHVPMTCNSFSFPTNGKLTIPMTCNMLSFPTNILATTKILATSRRETFMWANSIEENGVGNELSLTPNFILPKDKRPNLLETSKCNHTIPIIDIGGSNINNIVRKMVKACEEYGFFIIVNHSVPQELCQTMLSVVTDFFHLPPQDKALLVSDDSSKDVRISNHYRKDGENAKRFSMWSEVFKHPWHPSNDSFASILPTNPPNYRNVMTAYAKEIGNLMGKLFSLLSLGLGMDEDYIQTRLGKDPLCRVQANYYPPCPNPDLTLGLGVHTDRDALTVVLPTPNVQGLQIMKDDQWIMVDPIPNALVVNIGDQLQILSNGKYKSVLHRVVTNESERRVSLAMFYGPDKDALIGPIEDLIDEDHPRLYRDYYFREFLEIFRNQEGKNRKIKEFFEI